MPNCFLPPLPHTPSPSFDLEKEPFLLTQELVWNYSSRLPQARIILVPLFPAPDNYSYHQFISINTSNLAKISSQWAADQVRQPVLDREPTMSPHYSNLCPRFPWDSLFAWTRPVQYRSGFLLLLALLLHDCMLPTNTFLHLHPSGVVAMQARREGIAARFCESLTVFNQEVLHLAENPFGQVLPGP